MKLSRILLTGALSVSMLAMGAVGSFADLDTPATSDQTNNTITRVSKSVTKAKEGVTTPTATFKYTFTDQFGKNGAPTDAKDGPDISEATVTVNNNAGPFTSTDIDLGTIFKDAETGRYVYKVAETKENDKGDAEYGWTNDTNTFTLQVFKQADGTINYTIHNDSGNAKVDGKDETVTIEGKDETLNVGEFAFNNTFTKRAGSDNDDPDDPTPDEDGDKTADSLVVSKALDGDYADETKDFTFTITFVADTVNGSNTTFKGVKVDANGEAGTATDIASNTTFTLKGGEKMVFNNIPAGTKATVVETSDADYNTTYEVVANGNTGGTSAENILLGEKTNTVTVTNESKDVDITGLVMNNAPYVALIALALAMAAAYIMIRRRAGEME